MAQSRLNQMLSGLSAKPEQKPLDPQKVMCVVKTAKGKEVGKIPAACRSAEAFITELVSTYGSCSVDYVEDEEAVNIHRMAQHHLW